MRSPNRTIANRCDACAHSITQATHVPSKLRRGAKLCQPCSVEEFKVDFALRNGREGLVHPAWLDWVRTGAILPT